jgi:hypothetical protein
MAARRVLPGVSRRQLFPARGESVEPARNICARCLVHQECAESVSALPWQESFYGIWAGRAVANGDGCGWRRYRRSANTLRDGGGMSGSQSTMPAAWVERHTPWTGIGDARAGGLIGTSDVLPRVARTGGPERARQPARLARRAEPTAAARLASRTHLQHVQPYPDFQVRTGAPQLSQPPRGRCL